MVWFGCDLFLNDFVWYYLDHTHTRTHTHPHTKPLHMVWFGVIFTFFGSNGCFIVWFGCDLVLNDLVWYFWVQVRSALFCFWSDLVSFGVVWCDFFIFWVNRCFIVWFGCDLLLHYLVWYYLSQDRSELVCFWCGLVSFGVVWCDFYICCGNRCFIVWFVSEWFCVKLFRSG